MTPGCKFRSQSAYKDSFPCKSDVLYIRLISPCQTNASVATLLSDLRETNQDAWIHKG